MGHSFPDNKRATKSHLLLGPSQTRNEYDPDEGRDHSSKSPPNSKVTHCVLHVVIDIHFPIDQGLLGEGVRRIPQGVQGLLEAAKGNTSVLQT